MPRKGHTTKIPDSCPSRRPLSMVSVRAAKDEPGGLHRFLGTTQHADAHDSVVITDGIELDRYLANPVVTTSHRNAPEFLVGQSETVTKLEDPIKGLEFGVRFAVNPDDPQEPANRIDRLVRMGILRGASIGWASQEIRLDLTDAERAVLGLSPFGFVITRAELSELSVAPIPSNPETLKRALAADVITMEDADWLRGRAIEGIQDASQDKDAASPKAEGGSSEDLERIMAVLERIEAGRGEFRDVVSDLIMGSVDQSDAQLQALSIGIASLRTEIQSLRNDVSQRQKQDLARALRQLAEAANLRTEAHHAG